MMGFLVGYQPGKIYRIYHPGTKEFKILRDVIFSENQFFDTREVMGKVEDILPSGDEIEHESDHEAESELAAESGYKAPSATDAPSASPKPPTRRSRRLIAKAFKAVIRGNWKWPRNYREAMAAEDAKQWEIAM
jgi:hypothetical protein